MENLQMKVKFKTCNRGSFMSPAEHTAPHRSAWCLAVRFYVRPVPPESLTMKTDLKTGSLVGRGFALSRREP